MVVFFNSSDTQYTRRNGLPLRFGSKIDKNAQKCTNYLHKFPENTERFWKSFLKIRKDTIRRGSKGRVCLLIIQSQDYRIVVRIVVDFRITG